MFDIGWAEMAVVALVALIVIGPRDLPRVLYNIGKVTARARAVLRDLQQGVEDMAREAELEEVKKTVEAARNYDVRKEIERTIDPTGSLARELDPTMNSDGVRKPAGDCDEKAADDALPPPAEPSGERAAEAAQPRSTAHLP